MRDLHYVFMVIVIVVLVWRVFYAFSRGRMPTGASFSIGKKGPAVHAWRACLLRLLQQQEAHVAKYNVLRSCRTTCPRDDGRPSHHGIALLKFNIAFINMSPRDLILGELGVMLGSVATALWSTHPALRPVLAVSSS